MHLCAQNLMNFHLAQKYRINFTEVACGSIYYQCVYLLVDKTEGVLAAGAAARKAFGITTGPSMPHLSLLYSDIPQEERAKVGAACRLA